MTQPFVILGVLRGPWFLLFVDKQIAHCGRLRDKGRGESLPHGRFRVFLTTRKIPCDIHHSPLRAPTRNLPTFRIRSWCAACGTKDVSPERTCSTRPSAPPSTVSTPTLFRWKSIAPASKPIQTTSTPSEVVLIGFDAGAIDFHLNNVGVKTDQDHFHTVGLPDAAVRESRDRVRAALKNCGYALPPTHITINLAPADIKKEGSGFDLPMALGIVGAYGGLNKKEVPDCLFV